MKWALEWAGLFGALVVFLGPGLGLLSLYPRRKRFDVTQTVALGFGLSLAGWAILLAWLHGLGWSLSPPTVWLILGAGWVVALTRSGYGPDSLHGWMRSAPRVGLSSLVLWLSLGLAVGVGLGAVRDLVAGQGSDSYHHTLIVQMILDRGRLPDDLQPYASLASFTYHFGFHGFVAAIAWLTGLPALTLVPLLGQILNAAAALSAAFLAQAMTGSRSAAAASAIVVGLGAVLPAYMMNWGRYTQLTGLVLLPLFLGLVWDDGQADQDWALIPMAGVLTAGITLAHYRVALMAGMGALVVALFSGRWFPFDRARRLRLAGYLLGAALVAGVLIAPWVVHVARGLRQGYPIEVGYPAATYFALARLGPGVINYPTNLPLLALAGIAVLLGLWQRDRAVLAMLAWSGGMLFLSTPRFAGVFMDTVSVVIALYLPGSVLMGSLAQLKLAEVRTARLPRRAVLAVWAGLAGVALVGAQAIAKIADPTLAYVTPADLTAAKWIQANTLPSARFMVNTFHWDFLPHYITGSDAGYWLPVLADRRTVLPPLFYTSERASEPDLVERLVTLDRLGGHLASPEALAALQREEVTHVYVGQRGGPIAVSELLNSPAYALEYQSGSVYVFRLLNTGQP